jgi:N-acetylneuraminic acid mutarotase
MHTSRRLALPAGIQALLIRSVRVPAALLAATVACQEQQSDPALLAPSDASAEATAGQWIMRANMPSDRVNTTTATVTDAQGRTTLYVVGGRNPSSTAGFCSGGLSKVQAYNASTDTWTTRAAFPYPIQYTNGAGVIKGKIYLTGGCTGYGAYYGWTWMYDPATNTWAQKQFMPVDTWAGLTGVIQDKLYVLSSCDGQEDCGTPTNLFFGFYDPTTDTWTRLPNPPGGSAHLFGGSAVIGGRFYVVGGWGSQAVEVYDPATGQWTTRAAMGSRRDGVASAAVGGKMYVIAGFRRAESGYPTPVATTSVYDPTSNTWTNLTPAPRSGPGLAAGRVVVNGEARVALVGGARPGNNFQFLP